MCNCNNVEGDPFLTTSQAAAYTAMSPVTWYTKRSREPWALPPASKLGRCVRYRFSAVVRWAGGHRETEPPED